MGKHAFWIASFQYLTKTKLWDYGKEITEAIFLISRKYIHKNYIYAAKIT